jgi:cytochrome c-type biogenesis protein CcmH/NrfF
MLGGVKRARLLLATLCVMVLSAAAALADGADHSAAGPSDTIFTEHIPGAQQLEGQLLAPCCWDSSRQTIDIHGSPISIQLRREIRTRLLAGEPVDAVRADLVARYTDKILAVPTGNPLRELGVLLAILLGVAAVGIGALMIRWRNRGKVPPPASGPPREADAGDPDEWDERLDAELRKADS